MSLALQIERRRVGIGLVTALLASACANGTLETDPTGGDVIVDGGTGPKKDGGAPITNRDSGTVTPGNDAGPIGDPDSAAAADDAAIPSDPDSGPTMPVDSGPTNPVDSGPTTCAPATPSYSPTWHARKGARGDCLTADIDDAWTACANPATATQAACNTYANGFFTGYCYDCLFSQSTETTWGVTVNLGTYSYFNVGACYAANGASTTCSHAWQYLDECESAACDAPCSGSETDNDACINAVTATGGACATHATNATTGCAGASAAAKQACALKTSTELTFKSLGAAMCGP